MFPGLPGNGTVPIPFSAGRVEIVRFDTLAKAKKLDFRQLHSI